MYLYKFCFLLLELKEVCIVLCNIFSDFIVDIFVL
jgi:hypothetical protein